MTTTTHISIVRRGAGRRFTLLAVLLSIVALASLTSVAMAITQNGTNGPDVINLPDSNDSSNGRAGNDEINGNGGNDTLSGEDGRDILRGGLDHDTLRGGDGDDELRGDPNVSQQGDVGSDNVYGGDGDDIISGGAIPGTDFLSGGDGDDVINSFDFDGTTPDVVKCGDGYDTVWTDFEDGSPVDDIAKDCEAVFED